MEIFNWIIIVALGVGLTVLLGLCVRWCLLYIVRKVDNDDPKRSAKLLKLIFAPLFVLFLVTIFAYTFLQRGSAGLVADFQDALSVSVIGTTAALLGLAAVFGGIALILGWSRPEAANYQGLEDEKQDFATATREWQERLDSLEAVPGAKHEAASTTEDKGRAAAPAETNGKVASDGHTRIAAGVAVIFAFSAIFGACTRTRAVSYGEKKPEAEIHFGSDASGVRARKEFVIANEVLLAKLPEVAADLCSREVSVFWFGHNGWSMTQKDTIELPPCRTVDIVMEQPAKELDARRDAKEEIERRSQKDADSLTAKEKLTHIGIVRSAFGSKKIADLIPGESVQSECTDLNGVLQRYENYSSPVDVVVILATDSRENCSVENTLKEISLTQARISFVVIVVPADGNSGSAEFKRWQDQWRAAVPWAVVEPHYNAKDLVALVKEARQRSSKYYTSRERGRTELAR